MYSNIVIEKDNPINIVIYDIYRIVFDFMSYPNITDRIAYLETKHTQDMSNFDINKANKTDLDNYLHLSGGTLYGNLNVQNMYCNRNDQYSSTTWGISDTWENGPSISLYSNAVEGLEGVFAIRAMNKDKTGCQLVGYPNGGLFWNNQELPTNYFVGGNNASARVWSNGWVEQWGYYPEMLTATSTVTGWTQTFPIPFVNDYYYLGIQPSFMGNDWGAEKHEVAGKYTTAFTFYIYNWRSSSTAWYCWYAWGAWR